MKKFLYILFAVALFGCEQYEHIGYGGEIEFSAGIVSRGVVSQSNITDTNNCLVQLFATNNNTAITNLNDKALTRDNTTGKWFTTNNNRPQWSTGSYAFHAYARSPKTGNGLTISNNGLNITVSQPSTYDASEMIDYLLSYSFKTSRTDANSPKPLVQLKLEHAMAAVDIYVIKGNNFGARLTSITYRNIYTQGSMKCTAQATANSGERNVWEVQPSGNNNASYTFTPASNANTIATSRDETQAKMSILCLPQQLTASTELVINYQINEKNSGDTNDNWVSHSESFKLYNYNPMNYQPGHRVIYTVTVDSGVNLEGTITAWKDVDYIEGTILPVIPGNGNGENN